MKLPVSRAQLLAAQGRGADEQGQRVGGEVGQRRERVGEEARGVRQTTERSERECCAEGRSGNFLILCKFIVKLLGCSDSHFVFFGEHLRHFSYNE